MVYSRGHKFISIEMNDLLGGKKPGLYIGEGNQLLKVGTFGNEAKAKDFQKFLEYLFGDELVKENEPTS